MYFKPEIKHDDYFQLYHFRQQQIIITFIVVKVEVFFGLIRCQRIIFESYSGQSSKIVKKTNPKPCWLRIVLKNTKAMFL